MNYNLYNCYNYYNPIATLMTTYELVFLLNEEADISSVKQLIESLSGKLVKEEAWGKKTLAYIIKKVRSAFFFDWMFEIDAKQTAELRKKLNFNEKILRYLLLVSED